MERMDTSIMVIGAGAVGGITAAFLSEAGYDTLLVTKYDDYAEKVRDEGLNITGVRGKHKVKMTAVAKISEAEGKKDFILLAMKAGDMPGSASEALPYLKDNGCIIAMQNGICEYDLASVAGNSRTVGCVVGWGATMNSAGNLAMTSAGDFIIGYIDREPDRQLEYLATILRSVVPVRTTSNILGHRFSKLIINSCITSMGAVCGLYLGQMLSVKRMRKIFVNIIREAVAVAEAMKIKPEIFGGKLDFVKFIDGEGWLADLKRDITIRVIGFKYRKLKSSSLQSLERGKRTEIDYLNGFLSSKAALHRIEAPVNRRITEIIKLIEEGKATIGIGNFDDPAFD